LFSPSGAIDQGFVAADGWILKRTSTGDERVIPVSAVELAGRHMLHNVVAAAAVASIAGAEPSAMGDALKGFHGLEHVMEPVATVRGVRFVNDSKATNVESALRSIESFDRDLVPIMGGRFKGGDLRLLRDPLKARGKAVVAIGEARPLLRDALSDVVPVEEADSFPAAIDRAYELAKPSGVVLLAPACASFDMFRDYAERGRRFKEEVKRLSRRAES
jgi:UDP-N-acetylmuramoylalanine--D-glutamate ligase